MMRNESLPYISRRALLKLTAGSIAGNFCPQVIQAKQLTESNTTEFQLACMTLPYSQFPLKASSHGY